MKHVVQLFLLKTIINVDQSGNGSQRGFKVARHVFHKSSFLNENGLALRRFDWSLSICCQTSARFHL